MDAHTDPTPSDDTLLPCREGGPTPGPWTSAAEIDQFDLYAALETCAQLLENLHGRQLLLSSTLGGHVTLNFEDAVADVRAAVMSHVERGGLCLYRIGASTDDLTLITR